MANRQPGKALPYVLRLRRANVFDLIREHNLFTDVQDQALLLVEFDQELVKRRRGAGEDEGLDKDGRSPAIALLVDHTFSIPVSPYSSPSSPGPKLTMLCQGSARCATTAKPTLLPLLIPRRIVRKGPSLSSRLRRRPCSTLRRVRSESFNRLLTGEQLL